MFPIWFFNIFVRPGSVVNVVRAVGPRQSVGWVSVVGPADQSDRSANVSRHCRSVTAVSDLRHVRRR